MNAEDKAFNEKFEKSQATVKKIREALVVIGQVEDNLWRLASSFVSTGNLVVAEKLENSAWAIADSLKEIREGMKEQSDKGLKDAQEMTGAMMNGIFAGLELGRKEAK